MPVNKVYGVINDRILESLERGVVPWSIPWVHSAPRNIISGKEYKGTNIWMLGTAEHDNPYWGTYKQWKDKGGQVLKKEDVGKGTPIVFFKMLVSDKGKKDASGNKQISQFPLMRYSTVFNVEQTDLIDDERFKLSEADNKQIVQCEDIVTGFKNAPELSHKNNGRAYYTPATDIVNVPDIKNFTSAEEYYSTLFHELGHSTGAIKRLNRFGKATYNHRFGSQDYSKEELIAEMIAAYACGICGIDNKTIDRNASYIDGWMKRIKDDSQLFIKSAAAAQKATDYIRGV